MSPGNGGNGGGGELGSAPPLHSYEVIEFFRDDCMVTWKETTNTIDPDWSYYTQTELSCSEGYIYIQEHDNKSDSKIYRYLDDYIDYGRNLNICFNPNNPQSEYYNLEWYHGFAVDWVPGVKQLPRTIGNGVLAVGPPYSQGKKVGTDTMCGRPVTHYTYSYNNGIEGEFWLDDATGASMKVIAKEYGVLKTTHEILEIKVGGVQLIDGIDISQYRIHKVQN